MGHKRRRDFTGTPHEIRAAIKRTARGVRVVPKLVRQAPIFASCGSSSTTPLQLRTPATLSGELPQQHDNSTPFTEDTYGDYTSTIDLQSRRAKSQHDYQHEFLGCCDDYMKHILAAEAWPANLKATCGHEAIWRCVSCNGRPTFCAPCCREAHTRHPLHRVERWQGRFFQPTWLRELGVQVHCGHGGSPCVSLTSYGEPGVSTHAQTPNPRLTPARSDLQDDDEEEAPLLIEVDLSDCDDEDAQPYTGSGDIADGADTLRIADLPWIGEPPSMSAPLPGTARTFTNDRMMVVVDTSGIHELPFTFCTCQNGCREDLQLLDLGYYPATKTRPRTVFTFRVLDAFALAGRECNASARNYYNMLRRTSNSAFPHMVPDRYRELLRVSRQWRILKMRKWAGFGHRQGPIGLGDLAVRCPACPQPSLNLADGWEHDPAQWKYTRGVVLDGNFSAQHRPMEHPEKDVRLADGHVFTVADAAYKDHLKSGKEYKEATTCNDHRAVLNAAVSRGKYEATGIGAAACSRHGFFQPHACVDFQLGERQINMDYILHWIFAFMNGLTIILVLYDIMCQYYTNLHRRFQDSPALHMPPGMTIRRGIGQFHVHGHLTRCFPRYSLNFIRGVGIQDGEVIETLWNKINGIAGSTRGMGSAHRHELIDDRMNDSNWMKLTRIVPLLTCRWKRVITEFEPAVAAFMSLSDSTTPAERLQWHRDALAADRARDDDVTAMDLYDVHNKPAPTQKEVQEALLQQELREKDLNIGGATSWIAAGLRLEERKLSLAYSARQNARSPSDAARITLSDQRLKLARALRVFHTAGRQHVGSEALSSDLQDPTLLGEEWDSTTDLAGGGAREDPDPLQPEHHPLALPSTLGIQYLTRNSLMRLADKELQLREGQMNDCLQAIRTGIGYKSMLFRTKVRGATSTREKLRSFDDVHVADDAIQKHVRIYSQSRTASLRLLDSGTPQDREARQTFLATYKPIAKADLKASTTVLEAYTPGLRGQHEAWFWSVDQSAGVNDPSWMREFRRAIWLRAYARKERLTEEREVVPLEMECTVRFFRKRAMDWEGWGRDAASPGHTAYAERQAEMWRQLAEHAEKAFARALAMPGT